MNSFEFSEGVVGVREIGYSTASIIVGVSILALPRLLAESTETSDGWMTIIAAGLLALLFAAICAKLAASFPGQSFFEYSSAITVKPIGTILTVLYSVYFLAFTSYVLRSIADIASNYLFDRTPRAVIALVFLLTVIYAVAGSRAALLRLNLIFFPIVFILTILIQLMSMNYFEWNNLRPMFVTELSGLWMGMNRSAFSFLGFEMLLFYVAYMDRPKRASKAALTGIATVILLYVIVYIFAIGVFGQEVTAQIAFPAIENAKEVVVPGEFFERFESVFLTIWFMTVFNTSSMTYDLAVVGGRSVFPKINKRTLIFILAPVIYICAMLPKDIREFNEIGQWLGWIGLCFAVIVPCVLYVMMKVRGLGYGK